MRSLNRKLEAAPDPGGVSFRGHCSAERTEKKSFISAFVCEIARRFCPPVRHVHSKLSRTADTNPNFDPAHRNAGVAQRLHRIPSPLGAGSLARRPHPRNRSMPATEVCEEEGLDRESTKPSQAKPVPLICDERDRCLGATGR
ncbi:hypothetical protein MTO96_016345 [Rhipicephalus appendiculatus]